MKKYGFIFISCLFIISSNSWSDPEIQLTSIPSTVRILPTGEVQGEDTARIFGARNEVESFQVVITARDGNLDNVRTKISELQNDQQNTISHEVITLFSETFVPVRHSSPHALLPPGWYPDPLVPFVDPYTRERVNAPRWRNNQLEDG